MPRVLEDSGLYMLEGTTMEHAFLSGAPLTSTTLGGWKVGVELAMEEGYSGWAEGRLCSVLEGKGEARRSGTESPGVKQPPKRRNWWAQAAAPEEGRPLSVNHLRA